MTTHKNKALIKEYFAALSGKEKPATVINKYVDDEELRQHIDMFEAAFPRYELNANDMIAEDDKVAVYATFRGTHAGYFMGLAPTGKEVTIPLMLVYHVVDNKIADHSMVADQLGLMQQLGIVPVP